MLIFTIDTSIWFYTQKIRAKIGIFRIRTADKKERVALCGNPSLIMVVIFVNLTKRTEVCRASSR